jgi:hypothetical protein
MRDTGPCQMEEGGRRAEDVLSANGSVQSTRVEVGKLRLAPVPRRHDSTATRALHIITLLSSRRPDTGAAFRAKRASSDIDKRAMLLLRAAAAAFHSLTMSMSMSSA